MSINGNNPKMTTISFVLVDVSFITSLENSNRQRAAMKKKSNEKEANPLKTKVKVTKTKTSPVKNLVFIYLAFNLWK